jgi:hypothetical protein
MRAEKLSKSNTDLKGVLELIRESSATEAGEIIRRIREAETLDDAVTTISSAALLLQSQPKAGGLEPTPGNSSQTDGFVAHRGSAVTGEPSNAQEARLGPNASSSHRLMSR